MFSWLKICRDQSIVFKSKLQIILLHFVLSIQIDPFQNLIKFKIRNKTLISIKTSNSQNLPFSVEDFFVIFEALLAISNKFLFDSNV